LHFLIQLVMSFIAGSLTVKVLFNLSSNITTEYQVSFYTKGSKSKGESKTPLILARTLISKDGRLVLLASIKNPLTQELIVEGRGYSIPPYENGRVSLRHRCRVFLTHRCGEDSEKQRFIIPPQETVDLELHLEPETHDPTERGWEKEGFFALIHLRFVHYQRNGRLTSSFKTLLGMPFEELHKERNVVLVCYLDPQDERAEVVYEFPGWL